MRQLPLPFPGSGGLSTTVSTPTNLTPPSRPLTASSTFASAVQAYSVHLDTAASKNTARNFGCDVALMQRFIGPNKPIGAVSAQDITDWIAALHRSDPRLSPKTINRRVSAVRHFFRWLHEQEALPANPAASIPCRRITPPLPIILTENECQQLEALSTINVRTHVIVSLLLSTGIKKGELTSLRLAHFELTDPQQASVWILHETSRRHKDRKLRLPPEVVRVIQDYLARYNIDDRLFECTDRNIEYIFKGLERRLGTGKRITAQILRDTYAVRLLKSGVAIDTVMQKLGLAPSEWNQVIRDKYLKLAAEAM